MYSTYLLTIVLQLVCLVAARSSADEYATNPNIYELTPSTFNKVVYRSNYTTIVKFYAPWCGYCQRLKPIYEKLGKLINQDTQYSINVASVNCENEENKPLCSLMRIQSYPTILIFRPPKYELDETKAKKSKRYQSQQHANEVYNGERTVKDLSKFLISRMKNYVQKFHNLNSDDLEPWFGQEGTRPKLLLVTQKRTINPLLKSLAIDFLERVDIGMVSKDDSGNRTFEIGKEDVVLPGVEGSALFYYDSEGKKFVKYDRTEKLDDTTKITQWIIDVTKVNPIEGPLSKKGAKFEQYRTGKKSKKSTTSSELKKIQQEETTRKVKSKSQKVKSEDKSKPEVKSKPEKATAKTLAHDEL